MVGQLRPMERLERRVTRDRLRKPVSSLPHIRAQLKESKAVQKSIRDTLVPRRELKVIDQEPRFPRSSRLPDIVYRQKERLRIKFGIEIRREEMAKRKRQMEGAHEVIVKWERNVAYKYCEFEIMCKKRNDAASEALMEAEQWTRKRTRLSRPVVMLDRSIQSVRAEISEKEDRFEKLSEYKTFIILIFHNFTNSIHRPITKEQFLQLPNQSEIIDALSLNYIDGDTFAIKESRLSNKSSEYEFRLEELSPDDIEYELEELESRNLRLIENWQASADELSDAMHAQCSAMHKLDKSLKDIKSQINMACAEIIRCNERSEELEFYCSMFVEGVENGLFTGDEILAEYKRKVRRLYNHVTETSTMNIEVETLVMLTAVETRLMDLIMEEEQLDSTKVRDAQREIERRRKTDLYDQKNREAEKARLARNLRALERNKQTQKTKKGRRLMKRSKPFDMKKQANSTEDFNAELNEEESLFFHF